MVNKLSRKRFQMFYKMSLNVRVAVIVQDVDTTFLSQKKMCFSTIDNINYLLEMLNLTYLCKFYICSFSALCISFKAYHCFLN